MSSSTYLDFDLQLTANPAAPDATVTYTARVLGSPTGEAHGTFQTPLAADDLHHFQQQIGAQAALLSHTELQALLKLVGGRLFDALFQEKLLLALERSLDEAARQNATLRIKLRLHESPALLHLPWEYLYHPQRQRFLSQSMTTSFVHFLELPTPPASLTVALPLRMMVVIANPTDLAPLDVEREWTNLQTALSDLIQRGMVIVDRLPAATKAGLQSALRRQEYHILHFVGHGVFDEENQAGSLLFTTSHGLADPMLASDLARLLHNERTLRLVLLNACESAQTGVTNPFGGVAQALVQQGVPAVVAMRYPISDEAAVTFSHEFYAALADGYSVDAALTEARVAIATRLGNGEWGVPQLIMHAKDGMLWQVGAPPNPIDGAAIGQDLGLLTGLMQSAVVRALVVTYHADFRAASEQIERLSHYKDLHDLLHKLHYRCYSVIAQEAPRFPQDELALDNLLNYEVTLQDITTGLQQTAQKVGFIPTEISWIADVVQAQVGLQQAIEALDSEKLRRTLWLLRRVLALQPSNINHRLIGAARALRLTEIVASLAAIRDALQRLRIDGTRTGQFTTGVDALQQLNTRLQLLMAEHDQWQEVQRILGRIEDVMLHDLTELEFSWPDLRQRVDHLCTLHKGEWVDLFCQDRDQLEKAIAAQNPVRIRSYFQRYRQRAGNRFFQVDTQLKELCAELRKVGDSLVTILKVLE
ncbi:MAG: CHAT domain-containing protein [Caldilineaceae bacterium]|nr:CHAT domain-containing protein [Caldilineaceae bacterium]